ncbi:MAG: multidrug resistance protein [Actinomycetota bacterium]|nr:multidrug resistance protein [Actinomycetota bacterium]
MALEAPPPEILPVAAPASTTSTLISVALLVVSVTFATAGQLTLKAAMESIGRIGSAEVADVGQTLGKALREPLLWIGLTLFGFSAVFWLVVLSRVDLSLAYPFVGLSYIVVVALGRFMFHEQVPTLRWVGVSIIAVGIALIGVSSKTVGGS